MEDLKSPVIIAVIDDLKFKNVAHQLASFLKYPLIDQNDITKVLLTSTTSFDQPQKNLPYEIISQITSIQLNLNINIVLNFSLTRDTPLEELLDLASSAKAHLIIVECESENHKTRSYDITRVSTIQVDNNSLKIKKIVSEMSIMLKRKIKGDVRAIENVWKDNFSPPVNDHLHALNFHHVLHDKTKVELVCGNCSKPCHDNYYKCQDCNDFNLHKNCAESASKISECPLIFIAAKPSHFDFQKIYKCQHCQKFSYECYDCLLQTHMKNEFLPTILHCIHHDHPLNFIIMPFRYRHRYLCNVCDKWGSSISYKCMVCDYYDVHVDCVLPRSIGAENDVGCSLKFLEHTDKECGICYQAIHKGDLYYDNPHGDIHQKCMPVKSHEIRALMKRKGPANVIWRIIDFSKIKGCVRYSETFSVGGSRWCLKIYPKGNDEIDHLSMHLLVPDSKSLPNEWSREVNFCLSIVNQINDKATVRKDSKRVFNADADDWGWESFIHLSKLYNRNEKYIVNDTLIVEAEVDVLKVVHCSKPLDLKKGVKQIESMKFKKAIETPKDRVSSTEKQKQPIHIEAKVIRSRTDLNYMDEPFTWKITDISKITETELHSDIFIVDACKWRQHRRSVVKYVWLLLIQKVCQKKGAEK